MNITMQTGNSALCMIGRFRSRSADARRFATIGWMDWSAWSARPDLVQITCDRLERLCVMVKADCCGLTTKKLSPIVDKAAELRVPVMFHMADPDAFFQPMDARNESYDELAAHPDWSSMARNTQTRNCLTSATV